MFGARKVSELFRSYVFQLFIYLFFAYERGNFRVQALWTQTSGADPDNNNQQGVNQGI